MEIASISGDITNHSTELSLSDIRDLAEKAVRKKNKDAWMRDIYPESLVYSVKDDKCFRQSYILKGNEISLQGTPTEVIRVTEYRPVAPKPPKGATIPSQLPWMKG